MCPIDRAKPLVDRQVVRAMTKDFSGAGVGLRRSFIDEFLAQQPQSAQFVEVAPENWIGLGGRFGKAFEQVAEIYPVALHGLSLNIGGYTELDTDLVKKIGQFMDKHNCPIYSEHLSYCADHGHLYDLMPIPFTEAAVKQTVARIKQVQDILQRRIALENVSYYAATGSELSELEFINAVVEEADCDFLLDVNNIYVNSINHTYDADEFLAGLPHQRAKYIHVAGHFEEAEDLRVDTHGSDVIDPVWQLLAKAYQYCGNVPTLLERDFNIPELDVLMQEVDLINAQQRRYMAKQGQGVA